MSIRKIAAVIVSLTLAGPAALFAQQTETKPNTGITDRTVTISQAQKAAKDKAAKDEKAANPSKNSTITNQGRGRQGAPNGTAGRQAGARGRANIMMDGANTLKAQTPGTTNAAPATASKTPNRAGVAGGDVNGDGVKPNPKPAQASAGAKK